MADESLTLEWRPVQGFPDYEIREDGVVRRAIADSRGRFAGLIMAQFQNPKDGRWWVALRRGYGMKQETVHIGNALARAFIGLPPSDKHQAAHNDGNCHNNNWRNIRWATSKENINDKQIHGTQTKGEIHPMAVLTEKMVIEIKEALKKPYLGIGMDLAEKYGVTFGQIGHIRNGRSWKHIA